VKNEGDGGTLKAAVNNIHLARHKNAIFHSYIKILVSDAAL
jgi:hypothetical protein